MDRAGTSGLKTPTPNSSHPKRSRRPPPQPHYCGCRLPRLPCLGNGSQQFGGREAYRQGTHDPGHHNLGFANKLFDRHRHMLFPITPLEHLDIRRARINESKFCASHRDPFRSTQSTPEAKVDQHLDTAAEAPRQTGCKQEIHETVHHLLGLRPVLEPPQLR